MDFSVIQSRIRVTDIPALKARIETFRYPSLGWGIIVFVFLAVFGILSPVLMIVYEAFFTWAKAFTTVTFSLGIIGVFAYIVFQILDAIRTASL